MQGLSEEGLLARLDERGTAYELYRHRAVWTASDVVPKAIAHSEDLAKSLLVQTSHGRERFLLVVPLAARVNLRGLAHLLGCGHLGLVPADQMEAPVGVGPGSVTPFALLNDPDAATCIIDAAFAGGHLCVHPLHNEATLRLSCDDLVCLLVDMGVRVRMESIPRL